MENTKEVKVKKKKEKKVSYKKLHKYDYIDNNYLVVDKNAELAMALCGISTGVSCLFFGALPFGVILYMISVLEKTSKYIGQSTFILIVCGVAIVGSLAASIFARVKCRKSKWAITNIVYISINLVISVLNCWFFIWLINTYGT
mgnify:CR=1 FL=1